MSTEAEPNGPPRSVIRLTRRPFGLPQRALVWLALGAVAVLLAALIGPLLQRAGRAGLSGPLSQLTSRPEAPEAALSADGAADVAGLKANSARDAAAGGAANEAPAAPAAAFAGRQAQLAQGGAAAPGVQPLPPLPASDRMIVKSGSLSLQVTDLGEGMRRVSEVVSGIPGAYVAASSTSYRADQPAPGAQPGIVAPPRPLPAGQAANLTLKVPAGDFDAAMERLRALGTPLSEQISTQEVTEEYVDLDAQVRSLEAVEQQYLRLLERAQRIEEILPLQQRVTEVRTQIDRLRGRMNLLQRRADLSTVSVNLTLPARAGDPFGPGEPRPVRTLRLALAGLGSALVGLLDAGIYLTVYLLPLAAVAGAYIVWRRSRRPGAGAGAAAAAPVAGP
jgi:hypothetical protein